jgi:hypothetical protein
VHFGTARPQARWYAHIMRELYRTFVNRVGTQEAIALAHDLEHWQGPMEAHRAEIAKLGFDPDRHAWADCPHAEARSLWVRAVALLGSRADDLTFLRTCAVPAAAHS